MGFDARFKGSTPTKRREEMRIDAVRWGIARRHAGSGSVNQLLKKRKVDYNMADAPLKRGAK